MEQESNLLQQASVDYLQQINQGVTALNSTAVAQRDISERTLAVREATSNVMDQANTNTVAAIQNQAYGAYGTFQHDVAGLTGFTDHATRSALATMKIASGTMISDAQAMGMGAQVQTQGAVNRLVELSSPDPVFSQGFGGAIAGGLGMKLAPGSMTMEEFREMSRRQISTAGRTFGNYFTGDWGAAQATRYEPLMEKFRYRVNEGKLLSEEQIRGLSETAQSIRARSILTGNEKEIDTAIQMGAEVAYKRPDITGTQDMAKIKQELTSFAEEVNKLSKTMNMSTTDVSRALRDLSLSLGSSSAVASRFLNEGRATLRSAGIGIAENEIAPILGNALDAARMTGMRPTAGASQYIDIFSQVRQRMASNQEYATLVAQQGGAEAVAQNQMLSDTQFRRSNVGLFYAGAGNVTQNTSLTQSMLTSAATFSGGMGSVLRTRYDQLYGMDNKTVGNQKANLIVQAFRQFVPNASIDKIKIANSEEQKTFKGFMSFMLNLGDPNSIDMEFNRLFDIQRGVDTEKTQQILGTQETKIQQDAPVRAEGPKGLIPRIRSWFATPEAQPSSAMAPNIQNAPATHAQQSDSIPQQRQIDQNLLNQQESILGELKKISGDLNLREKARR